MEVCFGVFAPSPDSFSQLLRLSPGQSFFHLRIPRVFLFSQFLAACETDRKAIEAIGEALAGTGKPFVITSGTLLFSDGTSRIATEEDSVPNNFPRVMGEQAALALVDKNVRISIIRLPLTVHGTGDQAFIKHIVDTARNTGYSGYVGDGTNRWPAVHVRDAARLYLLALEKAPAGSKLHSVAEEGIYFRDIADAIGKGLGGEVGPQTAEKFGFLSFAVNKDNPTSSEITKKKLGWAPVEIGLLDDIKANYCSSA